MPLWQMYTLHTLTPPTYTHLHNVNKRKNDLNHQRVDAPYQMSLDLYIILFRYQLQLLRSRFPICELFLMTAVKVKRNRHMPSMY